MLANGPNVITEVARTPAFRTFIVSVTVAEAAESTAALTLLLAAGLTLLPPAAIASAGALGYYLGEKADERGERNRAGIKPGGCSPYLNKSLNSLFPPIKPLSHNKLSIHPTPYEEVLNYVSKIADKKQSANGKTTAPPMIYVEWPKQVGNTTQNPDSCFGYGCKSQRPQQTITLVSPPPPKNLIFAISDGEKSPSNNTEQNPESRLSQKARDALERELGEKAGKLKWTRAPSGKLNETYFVENAHGQKVVFRFNGRLLNIDRKKEAMAVNTAHQLQIGPKLIYFDSDVSIFEFFKGKSLLDAGAEASLHLPAIASEIKKFHDSGVGIDGLFNPSNGVAAHFQKGIESGLTVPPHLEKAMRQKREIDSRLKNAPQKIGPMHGDLHPEQILIPDRQVKIIDWEMVTTGPVIFDIANLTKRNFTQSQRLEFLTSYLGRTPTVEEHQSFKDYSKLSFLMMAVYNWANSNSPDQSGIAAKESFKKYLEEFFNSK